MPDGNETVARSTASVKRAFRGHGRVNYPTVLPLFDIPFEDAVILLAGGVALAALFSVLVLIQALIGLPTAPLGAFVFLAGTVRLFIEALRVRRRFIKRPHRSVFRHLTEVFHPQKLWRQRPDAERTLFPARFRSCTHPSQPL